MTVRVEPGIGIFSQVAVITRLTFREARRRKLLWLGLGMGIAFIALFTTGFYFAYKDYTRYSTGYYATPQQHAFFASTFMAAGLYVVNFLIVMVTVLTSVGTISAEVDNNTIHAIASKPIHRWQIVLGKWFGHAILLTLYTLIMTLGVMLPVYLITGYSAPDPVGVLSILILESLTVLSMTMLGSTLLSTLANGVLTFMLYGVAFVGGWVEQIGTLLQSQTARDLGIASSFLLPSEALWRYAAMLMQPSRLTAMMSPFASASTPSPAFIIYAACYTLALLGLGMWTFSRRDF